MTTNKNIKYLNKSFSDFKASLQEFAKTYFPDTYNDFSETSPGNMFIEMASYIGDVSSFYIDTQIQENFLNLAKEQESLYNLAYSFGYSPKLSYASTTDVQVSQLIPSNGGSPDLSYCLLIPANTTITSDNFSKFITTEDLDFSMTSSVDISFYNNSYFLFTKSVPVISAEIKSVTAPFSSPQKFSSFTVNDNNIIQILSVTGSDGAIWYEVPYLAQNTIFNSTPNSTSGSDGISYLLSLKNVPNRFVTRVKNTGSIELQFGAGISNQTDTSIIPTPDNINLGLIPSVGNLSDNYNKASLFFTKTYGIAPSTDLNIQYLVGGGIEANIPANSLTTIDTTNANSNWFKFNPANSDIKSTIIQNLLINNSSPAVGGRGADTVEEIRLNTLNAYTSQNRAVTKEDYIFRTLSLPSRYGNIAKAYITQETYNSLGNLVSNNPLSLDLYILAYNSDKQLIQANNTLKTNLKTYLDQYRMITDTINIKNAFYINIGVNFEITVDPSYNNNEILSTCISRLKTYFDIDSWQVNQPIIISEINSILIQVPGVRSVPKIEIINKQGDVYSPYGYDITGATRNGVIYPSIDPSIFEIRFPDSDINGRIITY